ncbi:hypothetical protein QO006_003971 [Deinococcus enclensis]|uniref:Uncharacterized protein n=1 Tax=Deinococcus enclensis TaxID=1049582 RepID=A0ABT9MIT5_9DEIO|nr:hypothetical protein [Deinococcus enclensis]
MTPRFITAEQTVTPTFMHELGGLLKRVHEDGFSNLMHNLPHSVPWQMTAH